MGNEDPKNTSSNEPSVSSQTKEGQQNDGHSRPNSKRERSDVILPPLRLRKSRFWETEGFSEEEEKK